MAVAISQAPSSGSNSGTLSATASWNVAFASAPAVGSTLIAVISYQTASSEYISVPFGWTLLQYTNYGTEFQFSVAKISAGSGDQTTGFVTGGTTISGHWVCYEVAGGAATVAGIVSTIASVGGSATSNTVSLTPTSPNGLMLAVHSAQSSSALTSFSETSSTTATAQDVFLTTASGDTLSTWHTTGNPGTAAWSEHGTWSASCTNLVDLLVWIPGCVGVVQSNKGAFSASPISATLPAAPIAGHILLIAVSTYTAGAFTTPTNWTQIASGTDGTLNFYLYGKVSAGTESTVSITASSPNGNWVYVEAVNGPAAIATVLVGTVGSASSSVTTSTTSVTPTATGGLLLSIHAARSTSSLSAGVTEHAPGTHTAAALQTSATTSYGSIEVLATTNEPYSGGSAYSEYGVWANSCTVMLDVQVWLPLAASALTIALTGLGATSAAGAIAEGVSIAGTGFAGTSALGGAGEGASVALTGVSATAAAGALTSGSAAGLTGFSASGGVGAATATHGLSGVAAASALGTLASGLAFTGTGLFASGAAGSIASSGAAIAPTGVAATSGTGTIAASQALVLGLTGVAAASAIGALSESTTVAATGAAASSALGALTPTTPLSGIGGTSALGAVSSGLTVAPSGVAATGAPGALGTSAVVPLSGLAAATALGNVSSQSLVGQAATTAAGTLAESTSAAVSGVAVASAVGTVTESAAVALTGVSASTSTGAPVTAQAVSDALGGISGAVARGALTEGAATALSGMSTASATGSPVASSAGSVSVVGVAATTAGGTPVSSQALSAAVSGVGASSAAGTVYEGAGEALSGAAGTSATGAPSSSQAVSVALLGLSATTALGAPVAGTLDALTGVAASGATGALSSIRVLGGVAAATGLGSVSAALGVPPLLGDAATTAQGMVAATQGVTVALGGVVSTLARGALASATTASPPLGVAATGALGTLTVTKSASVALSGVAATSATGLLPLQGGNALGPVLPASFIEFLDAAGLGIVGDPSALTEILVAVIDGTLVEWISQLQSDVAVPWLLGAEFTRGLSDVTQPNAVYKAIATGYLAQLLRNVNFGIVDPGSSLAPLPPPPPGPPVLGPVLPPSWIGSTGEGESIELGDPGASVVVGDLGAISVVGYFGATAIPVAQWLSPYQSDVAVPLLNGAEFTTGADQSLPNGAVKAITAPYFSQLLANPNFVDETTGANGVAAQPEPVSNPTIGTPAPGGTYMPWSNAQSLALAWATDQFLVAA